MASWHIPESWNHLRSLLYPFQQRMGVWVAHADWQQLPFFIIPPLVCRNLMIPWPRRWSTAELIPAHQLWLWHTRSFRSGRHNFPAGTLPSLSANDKATKWQGLTFHWDMAEIFTVTRLEIDEPEHCKYLLLSHLVPVTHRFVICAAESLHVHALIRTSEDPRTWDRL